MKIKNKIISILILMSLMLPIYAIKTYAATGSFSASTSANQLNVGDTAQVTITANECAGQFTITSDKPNVVSVSGNGDFLDNSSKKFTITAKTAGTATVTVSATDVTDTSENAVTGSKPITITVKAPQQEQTTQNQTQQQTQQPAQNQTPVEPTFTNTNTTMYTTNDCNLRASWSTSSAATFVKKGTEVNVTGTSTQKVNGYTWYRVNYGGTKYIASFLLTSTKPAEEQPKEEQKQEEKTEEPVAEKSANKALKDLVIENYKLSPEFSPEVTKYNVEVKGDVEKLEITPVLQDEKSKFVIEGNENLKVGNNIIKITVTAEDGTARIYTLAVAKTDGETTVGEMLKLKDLKVNNANLQPSFSQEITNYIVEVEDPSSIKASDVVATAEDADVDVNISESVNTDKTEKIITIMLEDKEGTKTGVYQITVKKASLNPINAIKNSGDNKIYYILGGIIAVLLILIVIIIILLKKTSNKEDPDEEAINGDELSDNYDYSLKNAIDEANNTDEKPQYDDMVENSSAKSQILNPKFENYDVFKDNGEDMEKTQIYNDFDEEIKERRKGKHF